MRIAILLPDLRPGGAERMRMQLAEHWLRNGLEVEFVLCRRQGELIEQLPQGATIFDLGAPRVRHVLRALVHYLRQYKPDALLAAMWPLTVLAPFAVKLAGVQTNVVVSEHAPQSLAYMSRGRGHNILMAASMRLLYRLADGLVGVSSGVANDMACLSRLPRDAFTVIHNPAATGRIIDKEQTSPPGLITGGPLVLSVGTLKPVKRYDLLLDAFARLRAPHARLCILGEGQERPRLEALVRELDLQGRVLLPGYQTDTALWYAHADLFVLCSDHEGFGNVIVEALEQGTPVVSTDCPSGPREILEDGKYGTLVPVGDVGALVKAMDKALSCEHDRENLKRRAQDFNVGKAADAYLDLLSPGWREYEGIYS